MFTTYIKNLNDMVFSTVRLQVIQHLCMPLLCRRMHEKKQLSKFLRMNNPHLGHKSVLAFVVHRQFYNICTTTCQLSVLKLWGCVFEICMLLNPGQV